MTLNVPAIRHYEKYLGLPLFIGKNKTTCFIQVKRGFGLGCRGGRQNSYLGRANKL